jgi:two-component system, cell cycle sensor histidine kinase and response regulator CckA
MLNTNQTPVNEIQPPVPIHPCHDVCPARGTILVVEDEAFVREAASDILEGSGYQVLRAGNAVEAQAAFRRQEGSVQLLLSDVVLPGQNGLALAKALRAARPAVKILFISGYANSVTKYKLTTGQMAYLPKPFSAESLLGKVREVLESA